MCMSGRWWWWWWGRWQLISILLRINPFHISQDGSDLWIFQILIFSCWLSCVLLLSFPVSGGRVSIFDTSVVPIPVLSHKTSGHPLHSLKSISRLNFQWMTTHGPSGIFSNHSSGCPMCRCARLWMVPSASPQDLCNLRERSVEFTVSFASPESNRDLDFEKTILTLSFVFLPFYSL